MVQIQEFFDNETFTLTYVAYADGRAIIIDPVLNYDPASGKVTTRSIDQVTDFLKHQNLAPLWILETHAHADHISAAPHLKKIFPNAKTGIGERIKEVQSTFGKHFNLALKTDGSQFDHLFKDQEVVDAGGALAIKIHSTPGHTPACVTYQIGNALFTGDAIFMPDSGTGRCDFPGGSAETLYKSIHGKLYQLPDHLKMYVGHDYQPGGRPLRFLTSIQDQKTNNIQLKQTTSLEEFVSFRTQRDKTLSAPRLLLPSIQVNINAGHLPEPEANGIRYLKMPITL